MNRLLKSGRRLTVNFKDNEDQVTLKDGRILYNNNKSSICKDEFCWKASQVGHHCSEHGEGNKTHFLIRDSANPTPTFALLSPIDVHSPKTTITLNDMLKKTKVDTQFLVFTKYNDKLPKTNEAGETIPFWVLVTPRPWVTNGQKKSNEFAESLRLAISITFSLINSQQPDPKKHYILLADQVYMRYANWALVKDLLTSFGVGAEFIGDSELGTGDKSPLMDGLRLDRCEGKSWIYAKMGTIGRIHVGK